MILRRFFCLLLLGFLAVLTACEQPSPADVKKALQKANPGWRGEFMTGYYSEETPIFQFNDGPRYNAVALSGAELMDFSPLEQIVLRILSLQEMEITSLDFMRELQWEPGTILELKKCPDLTGFKPLSNIPLSVLQIADIPAFKDTSIIRSKLKTLSLSMTGVTKLELQHPDDMRVLEFATGKNPDLSQIQEMKKLNELYLKGVHNLELVPYGGLEYLEVLSLVQSDAETLPAPQPRILRSIWLEDCPNLRNLDSLNGKMVERLCLIRSGDPGKLLANLKNTKISMLVIKDAEVSDVSFLRRIKNLDSVRFQNCTGLPSKIQIPFVEVVVEDQK